MFEFDSMVWEWYGFFKNAARFIGAG